jgi:hypothetical protein
MPEIPSAPRLARNTALAAAAVLLTAAALTLAVLKPGGHPQACPSGEEWIIAAPVGVAMANYDTAGNPAAGAAGTATTPGTATASGTAPSSAIGEPVDGVGADPAADVLLLAGCIDTDRLHPIPVSTDGRG